MKLYTVLQEKYQLDGEYNCFVIDDLSTFHAVFDSRKKAEDYIASVKVEEVDEYYENLHIIESELNIPFVINNWNEDK